MSKEGYATRSRRLSIDKGLVARTVFVVFALSGLNIPDCPAQIHQQSSPTLENLSLEQLGNIEVTTASKEPEQIWQTAAAIYVITQEDIRRSGATSIPEILRLVPGVETARIDSDHWAVGVRGFEGEFSKALLVLIDGRSVYSPLFAGVYWQVQDTLFEDIDRIEVIRGPGGTIWGANAVNGVINIITKSAKNTHGAVSSWGGGSIDQGIGGSRFGGVTRSGLNYRVYGKGFIRASEFHPDGENFDEWRMGQVGFRTDWEPTSRDTLNLQGDLYQGRDGERVAESLYSPPTVKIVNSPHFTSGGNLTGSWRRTLGANSDIETRGYFDRTTRFSPQLDEIRNTFDLDLLYHLTTNGHQDILLGAGARWSPDHLTQNFATLDFTPHDETDNIYSWFVQDQIGFIPKKLSLILGSKFEHNNRSGFEVQPNGKLLWTPTSHQTVWAAVTRAVRTPSRLDQDLRLTDYLATTSLPVFLRVVGSPNFKSEHLFGTEIGYRTLIVRKVYMDFAMFRNDYNNLYGYGSGVAFIETAPAPAHLILQEPLANALKGDASGGEIATEWKPRNWLELKGAYSYLHLYVHDRAGFKDTQNVASDNGSSPHHLVVIQSRLDLAKRTTFDTTLRYVSSLPAEKVTAYTTVDARFGWRPSNNWDVAVVGQNLMQSNHAEFGSDVNTIVGIKRDVYATITWIR